MNMKHLTNVLVNLLRYDEHRDYNYNNGGFSMETGHFTQMVWKSSTKFGIAKATGISNGMKCTYVVARYLPAGNVSGQFKKNVGRRR